MSLAGGTSTTRSGGQGTILQGVAVSATAPTYTSATSCGSLFGYNGTSWGPIANVGAGSGFIGIGSGGSFASIATDGLFRALNDALPGLVYRNAAGTGNVVLIGSVDGSDIGYIGGTKLGASLPVSLVYQASTDHQVKVGGTTKATFAASLASLTIDLAIGTNPATTGAIRLPNAGMLYGRNAANSANLPVVGTDASNRVALGDSSGGTATIFYGGTSGTYGFVSTTFAWVTSNVTRVSLTSTGIDLASGSVFKLAGTVAASGEIRAANGTTIIAARDAANGADIAALGVNANDRVTSEGYIKTIHVAAITATASIANTETRVLGATIAANKLKAGDQIVFAIMGVETNTAAASTSVWRVRIGGVTLTGSIVASNSYTMGTTARTNIPFVAKAVVTILSVGANGTALGQVMATLDGNAGFQPSSGGGLTAAVTIDTTAAREVEITVISGAASTTWDIHSGSLEIKRVV